MSFLSLLGLAECTACFVQVSFIVSDINFHCVVKVGSVCDSAQIEGRRAVYGILVE